MTNVVLYTEDLEPITIIDLQSWAKEYLLKHGFVNLPVMSPVAVEQNDSTRIFNKPEFMKVSIQSHRLRMNDNETMFLTTPNEEAALLLKSTFLPGQIRSVQDEQRKAFAEGFLEALNRVGRF